MTYEFVMRDGTKFTINKDTMTGVLNGETRYVKHWPLAGDAGFEWSVFPDIRSWREIPDELPAPTAVPELPMVSSASVPSDAAGKQLNENNVPMPSKARVPDHDSGTDWIR